MDALRRTLIIVLLVLGGLYLLYEAFLYHQQRNSLPPGTNIGLVDVSGLTMDEAGDKIVAAYSQDFILRHLEETTAIHPADVGFLIDLQIMLDEAAAQMEEQEFWQGYLAYLLQRPFQPITVPLYATHNREAMREMIATLARFQDQPARAPQMISNSGELLDGRSGFVTDIEASLPAAEAALYDPVNRLADLVVNEEEAPPRDLSLLETVIRQQLGSFDGIGSIFIIDLQTGEELSINADKAISGLSILKIGIFVEAYRSLSRPPNEYEQQLFYDTAARSSNFAANLLLELAFDYRGNTYRAALAFTEAMRGLGLVNTFMAIPYGSPVPDGWSNTMVTPANLQADGSIQLDPSMQTTAEEIGTLLAMIYYCSKGGGALLAIYPDDLTPEECQAIIDLMILNEEGNLIRFGVPTGTPVSHKHGWIPNTHADAGIVYTPGGDFILVEYVHQPGDWLLADESFPVLREIARATYNYFNPDNPYLEDALFERDRFDPDDPFFQQLDEEARRAAEEGDELDEEEEDDESDNGDGDENPWRP